MAIKVNGTTVIDDSRNFTNIAGGFKTVNGTSVVGSGDISAGASTTAGAVGTYFTGYYNSGSRTAFGSTFAGSGLRSQVQGAGSTPYSSSTSVHSSAGLSGTWRAMGDAEGYSQYNWLSGNLFVRIS